MFVFNGKLHILQTRKYDVSMTSKGSKEYLTFSLVKYLFLLNNPWKIVEI